MPLPPLPDRVCATVDEDHPASSHSTFLVGCPRSGTTLLQSLIASHPQVYSLPETNFFRLLLHSEEFPRRCAPPLRLAKGFARARRRALARLDWSSARRADVA